MLTIAFALFIMPLNSITVDLSHSLLGDVIECHYHFGADLFYDSIPIGELCPLKADVRL